MSFFSNEKKGKQNEKYLDFPPKKITLKDDAFHDSAKGASVEWWYFDCIFDNGYSIHIGFNLIKKKKLGFANTILDIYKDGENVAKRKKRHLLHHSQASKEYPFVKMGNNAIMEFDMERYKKKGEWVYNVKQNLDGFGVCLTFVSNNSGFKIETDAESWAVPLPKASVTGDITINGKKINVSGIGYHDHNWNYTLLTLMNYGRGWYWGKIWGEKFTVIFANIIKSSTRSDKLAVIYLEDKGFFNINPKNINFIADKFIRDHRKKIPTNFIINFDDVVEDISVHVDAKMEAEEIHYSRQLVASYWRYHAKTTGSISLGSKKETIDSTQIIEYMIFS